MEEDWTLSDHEENHEEFDMDEVISTVIYEAQEEVRDWMKTYGRKYIREWMDDNAKAILRCDGAISKKEPLKRTQGTHNLQELLTNGGGGSKKEKENKIINIYFLVIAEGGESSSSVSESERI